MVQARKRKCATQTSNKHRRVMREKGSRQQLTMVCHVECVVARLHTSIHRFRGCGKVQVALREALLVSDLPQPMHNTADLQPIPHSACSASAVGHCKRAFLRRRLQKQIQQAKRIGLPQAIQLFQQSCSSSKRRLHENLHGHMVFIGEAIA